ncbi:hypothetical protein [Sphingopyxis sp. PET50]|uniref:hypothetical protein n=1 Tax=Sphingopyxis sp. PET50 TaxID=2976533 RepID=UPI0021AE9D95|nr:hypothetical protein [Sphingopyxis sp. PET50]
MTFPDRATLDKWLSEQRSLIRAYMDCGERHEAEEAEAELIRVLEAHGHLLEQGQALSTQGES